MAFMKVETAYGEWFVYESRHEGIMTIPHECIEDIPEEDVVEVVCQRCSGWCSRLSAPGYLDCTEWMGPYEEERQAIEDCCELYSVDEDGNDIEED